MREFPAFLTTVLMITALGALPAPSAWAGESSDWQSPEQVDGSVRIDTETAVRLHAEGVPFVDVRSTRQFNKRHIPGAHHLDLKSDLTEENLLKVGGKDEWMVVYCNGAHCARSYHAIESAVEWGFKKLYYFRAGFRSWRLAGNPLEIGGADGVPREMLPVSK
ncbi:MAG: rhodanese-like domain-containing protein [Gammaproteobacteria bacterium]